MRKSVSRRGRARLILYTVFVITVLAIATIMLSVRASSLSRQLTLTGQRSLSELDSYVSSISTSLSKGIYANTPTMLNTMATDLMRDANGAKNSLSTLPLSNAQLDNTYKFLSQVGAFVTALNKKISNGESISDTEREQLYSLLSISQSLSNQLGTMLESVQSGSISFQAVDSELNNSDNQLQSLETSMSDAEQTITEYPTLIYDGPFSDHILTQTPKMLEGKDEISKEAAQAIAAQFIGVDVSQVMFTGEAAGTLPSFMFSTDTASIAVTKQGGHVLYLLGSSYAGEAKLQAADAIARGTEFLTSKGFTNMKDSYYSINDGICTVNFAFVQDDYICYPDLIKVSISLETGNVISFDARGYIMNHTTRTIETPVISSDEAKQSVSPLLEVLSVKMAIIPTDAKGEQQTYEFHCKAKDGTEVLVYIDTKTGFEDDILLLLYSDGGILTK